MMKLRRNVKRIPRLIPIWIKVPRKPLISLGATSLMKIGGITEKIPTHIPVTARPTKKKISDGMML
jgi:hypothetical protein